MTEIIRAQVVTESSIMAVQRAQGSQEIKNESATRRADKYRISNKEYRIMKFFPLRYFLFLVLYSAVQFSNR
jgi:hypothetical protein